MELQEALTEKCCQKRGLCNLLGINALICGVEIVCSCAFIYIPPLLLKAGFTETSVTIILGIAPFLDLMTVPTLARWSEGCTSKFGRRRPFIASLSIVLMTSLYLIPCSLSESLISTNKRYSMCLLAVGVVLFDYAYQALFNPCESLLSDIMSHCDQSNQALGFTIYSACISLGCILGYLIGAIDWNSISNLNASNEQFSLGLSSFLFLICLLLTLAVAKENPTIHSIGSNYINYTKITDNLQKQNSLYLQNSLPCDKNGDILVCDPSSAEKGTYKMQFGTKKLIYIKGIILCKKVWKLMWFGLCIPMKVLQLPLSWFYQVRGSPTVIQRLFLTELSGWTAILCHSMFFTDFVGQYINEGVPSAAEHSLQYILYDQGVQMGSWALFLQSVIACVYAFSIQHHLVAIFGARIVFIIGLGTFNLCMILTVISPSVDFLYLVTAFSGLGFAALTTTPNMLVTIYNTERQFYMWDSEKEDSNPSFSIGIGTDIAILDMAYFLSQVILSMCLGPIIEITKSSLSYMVVSAIACSFSLYFGFKVVFTKQQLINLRNGKF